MRNPIGVACLAFLLDVASPSGFSQLRNLSEYSQDCINTEQTYFVLHDADAADFGWASEWTHMTVNAYSDNTAIFLWHFKDGSKAYSQQGDYIGDAGGALGYLLTGKAANLEDVRLKKIQPLSRTNYPVKVELWIGEVGDSTGFSPQTLVDMACFDAQSIETNHAYHFDQCH